VLQQSQQPLFYDQIPIFMHEYIKNVVNVDGDGNSLAIAFVNQNHYVAMVLKPGAPVPPIVNR
ncbi:497_t:CDS:2, partial [Cetraspora pellucida]